MLEAFLMEPQGLPEAASNAAVALAYGLKGDGRIVHVRDVPSGLACDCVCPHCRCRLVARRGEIKAPHFAHHHSEECKQARETALHLLAKQILEVDLCLNLPEWVASDGRKRSILQPSVSYVFDEAALECRLGEIVPDVIVRKGERELVVEIFVTHACDKAKVSKLRARGLSAIEIDLSRLPHDAPLDVVREHVLALAPRRWLANMRLAAKEKALLAAWDADARRENEKHERAWREFQSRMARRETARIARSHRLADTIISSVRHKPFVERADPRLPTLAMARVEKAGFSQYVGVRLKDDISFVACSRKWQAMVLDTFVAAGGTRSFSTQWAFNSIRTAGFIEPSCCGFIDDEVEALVREELPDFRKPYGVLWDYLRYLSANNLVMQSGNRWLPWLPISHRRRLS